MNALAINTACGKPGIALIVDNKIEDVCELTRPRELDSQLPPLVASFLNRIDPDTIVINRGPGNFTSIRVGLSFVSGLWFSKRFRLLTVNTFDTLLYTHFKNSIPDGVTAGCLVGLTGGTLAVCIVYLEKGKIKNYIKEPSLFDRHSMNALLRADLILTHRIPHLDIHGIEVVPDAEGVARAFLSGSCAETFLPGRDDALYLRKSDAELKWESIN